MPHHPSPSLSIRQKDTKNKETEHGKYGPEKPVLERDEHGLMMEVLHHLPSLSPLYTYSPKPHIEMLPTHLRNPPDQGI